MELEKIQKIMASTFQKVAIEEISLLIRDAIKGGRPLQPILLTGFAGLGKTHLVEKMAEILTANGFHYVEIPVGCSASQFWSILRDAKEYTFFFADEIHEIKCKNQLKAVTETGGKVKTFSVPIGKETVEIEIDPSKWVFVGASNEAIRDSALSGSSGRFRKMPLVPYDETARAELIKVLGKAYGVQLPQAEGIKVLAANVRPFARSIKNLVNDLYTFAELNNKPVTSAAIAREALVNRGYYPGGYTTEHVKTLKFLTEDLTGGKQVQEIASNPLQGVNPKDASAIISELQQSGFVNTHGNGRKIISKLGYEFLTNLGKPKAVTAK